MTWCASITSAVTGATARSGKATGTAAARSPIRITHLVPRSDVAARGPQFAGRTCWRRFTYVTPRSFWASASNKLPLSAFRRQAIIRTRKTAARVRPRPRTFHGWKGRDRVNTTVRQLAALVQGTIVGDGDLVVKAARPLGEAQAGDITFIEDDKHAPLLHNSRASAAVVPSFPFCQRPDAHPGPRSARCLRDHCPPSARPARAAAARHRSAGCRSSHRHGWRRTPASFRSPSSARARPSARVAASTAGPSSAATAGSATT